MRAALLLRAAAVAIAVAGVADPALSVTGVAPQPLTIAVIETSTLALPEGGGTRREAAWAAAERLRAALEDDFAIAAIAHPVNASAAACPDAGACVLISDGLRPRRLGAPSEVAGVKVGIELAPNVSLVGVTAPARVDPAAIATLDVDVSSTAMRESRTTLQVFDGPALVGQATHEWTTASEQRAASARVRVEWTPLASGPRELRVLAVPAAEEATALDNESHIAVNVTPMHAAVAVYEPAPSWGATFVRRALESDRRFVVAARTRMGASVAVSSSQGVRPAPGVGLDAATLAAVAVVVVSAPDQLTSTEVASLERFIRVRGGSVILLPERRPGGPIMRLIPGPIGERREAQPIAIGGLFSSELLTLDWPEVGTTILARADGRPVIASRAMGRGRLIVSGALDAWRFRGRDDGFARFWRALVADAADAAGENLSVTIVPTLARSEEEVSVTVDWAGAADQQGAVEISAALMCEGQAPAPIRLWPAGPAGQFSGTVAAGEHPGVCRADATLSAPVELKASAPLLVTASVTPVVDTADALTGAVAAHGGVVVAAGDEVALLSRLHAHAARAQTSAKGQREETRPMRSPWWIVPFAGCLGGEWWLRRRRGLR